MSYLRLLWIFLRIGAMNELAYRANFWGNCCRAWSISAWPSAGWR